MPNNPNKPKIVYAIYPNANGFGFVYMENPRKILDFGSVRINPISNRKVLNRIKQSFTYLRPSLVIVQDSEGKSSRTGKRVKKLIELIATFASEQNLPVYRYSRDMIRGVFSQFGGTTKYEISQILIKEFSELEARLPKKRKLWTSEDYNMAIFDALSLAITFFYLEM